ncbi:MAG: hypothetical protein PF481_02455 [Bacteroidales bacterium]|jgi:hypothetical protein|nr:hypothetical protein [Bacteroidales bacterium]
MKRISILLLFSFFIISQNVFSQSKIYEIYDTIPIRSGTNKYRLYRLAIKWMGKERGTKMVAKNFKQRKVAGKGYFVYYNRVKLEDTYVSPRANERTKGSIAFNIVVDIQDSIIITRFFNFVHKAAFSEYGTMSFGRLMEFKKVPPGVCMEIEEWCNAVWANLKHEAELECKYRASNMIPIVLIRRRTYKAKEEEKVEEVKEEVDPDKYLEIENYIIHDKKEEKATETTDIDEAPLSEDGTDESDEIEEEEIAQEEEVADEEEKSGFFSKFGKNKNEEKDEQEEEEEKPQKEEKVKKEKKSKKEKKKKKDEDEYDDYYDDYDDDY